MSTSQQTPGSTKSSQAPDKSKRHYKPKIFDKLKKNDKLGKSNKPNRRIELNFGPFKSAIENASFVEVLILIIVLVFLTLIFHRIFK